MRTTLRLLSLLALGAALLGLAAVTWQPQEDLVSDPLQGDPAQQAEADQPDGGADTGAPEEALVDSALDEEEEDDPDRGWIVHTISSGEVIGRLLPRFGAPIQAVLAAAKPEKDLSRIRAGEELAFRYEPLEVAPIAIRYALDEDRTLFIEREGDLWFARVATVTYESRMAVREFVVERTLWEAAVDAGLRPADIAAIARVFEYDLDFNTEIRAGARVRVVVDELWADGALARLAAPRAARLENAGKTYTAIRFTPDGGKSGYYDQDGVSRKGAFLRSPIAFGRVTSGFNKNRYHPILKKSRPHNGTDFGAPTGTPVRAVGDGVITVAGRSGGHGNFVKIDHSGPYDSSYSHLSRIAVKKGARVSQGQVIGYVGSTGLATGPHLHFQFWVNGKYVNPMSITVPRNERLDGAALDAFFGERDRWLSVLEGQTDPGPEAPEPEAPVIADAE